MTTEETMQHNIKSVMLQVNNASGAPPDTTGPWHNGLAFGYRMAWYAALEYAKNNPDTEQGKTATK